MSNTSLKLIHILTAVLLASALLVTTPARSQSISIDHIVCEANIGFTGFFLCKAVISGGSGPQNLTSRWQVVGGNAMLDDSPFPDIVTGYCEPQSMPLNVVQVSLLVSDSGLGQIDTRLSNPFMCRDPNQVESRSYGK